MQLKSIKYVQFEEHPREWRLEELMLNKVNLIVGKNASGKTKTLNVINGLANLLSGQVKISFGEGDFDAYFENKGKEFRYKLVVHNSKVVHEEFFEDGNSLMKRKEGGFGKILAVKVDTKKQIDFQVSENELAAVARRDAVQHPFFEALHTWGSSLFHFSFGSTLGKDHLGILPPGIEKESAVFNQKDTNRVIEIFRKGDKAFGKPFIDAIKKDMKKIGYSISKVGVMNPISITVAGLPGTPVVLFVQETDLKSVTDQGDMSQGMFRALSIVVQLNYAEQSKTASTILIDDIGEGLDFERSFALIELLMEKAKKSSVQLVMTTNDRFVMNRVPLEVWSVLQRKAGKCSVLNAKNSKKAFDEFRFTGLNNFDFFSSDFINESNKS